MKLLCILIALPSLIACGTPVEDFARSAKETAEDATDAIGEAIEDAKKWSIDGEHIAQRRRHCDREGGEWVERVEVQRCENGLAAVQLSTWDRPQQQACESGEGGLYEKQCVYYTASGQIYFNDGPSQPGWIQGLTTPLGVGWDIGKWASLFWASAVNHDYCYHHNGITHGYSQKNCDEQMLSDLSAICAQDRFLEIEWFSVDTCKKQAAITFSSVRGFGEDAWNMMNTQVDYPAWHPLWKKFGMAEDVFDAELARQVEERLQDFDDLKAKLPG